MLYRADLGGYDRLWTSAYWVNWRLLGWTGVPNLLKDQWDNHMGYAFDFVLDLLVYISGYTKLRPVNALSMSHGSSYHCVALLY